MYDANAISPPLRGMYQYHEMPPLVLPVQPMQRKRSFHEMNTTIDQTRRSAELAARLAILLHARRCHIDDCIVPNCSTAKGVLDHCQECGVGLGNCHTSCTQAKVLLKHYRNCKQRQLPCLLCSILRKEHDWAL
ncbi:hypothetical protein THRCLA_21285 [Thraustotheca clavata]|uniref:TAZ-type domain-containing protein n=1 Tax=Thraustotheca clavata TaxID=74557 RepID=A0A1V9ZY58_9STRA|nr:hypothetical protein THRCLA_21285 [Thraustotheca clavata]